MVWASWCNYCNYYSYQCNNAFLESLLVIWTFLLQVLGQKMFFRHEEDPIVLAEWVWEEIYWAWIPVRFTLCSNHCDDVHHYDVFTINAYFVPLWTCCLLLDILDRQDYVFQIVQNSSYLRARVSKELVNGYGMGYHFAFVHWHIHDFQPRHFQLQWQW